MRALLVDRYGRHRWESLLHPLPPVRAGKARQRLSCGHAPQPRAQAPASVRSRHHAPARIPHLLDTPAAVRFVSAEPLLGPVDLTLDGLSCAPCPYCADGSTDPETGLVDCPRCDGTGKGNEVALDLVIVGGESGPRARPMHPDWVRSLRDQCVSAGVSFHFKQWGEWAPAIGIAVTHRWIGNNYLHKFNGGPVVGPGMARIGKRAAGRLLDGRTCDEMPGGA
nr:DUF5131 family protein [Rhodobacter capsulatus]